MKIKKVFSESPLFISFFIVIGITFITHGSHLFKFGFYEDDWYLLWSGLTRGSKSIIHLFSMDRPFMGIVNYFDYLILGDNLTLWQLTAFGWRLLNSVLVLWLVSLIWPNNKFGNILIAVLVTIFPAYLDQPIVVNYKNYIMEYTIAIFSILISIYSLQCKKLWKKNLLLLIGVLSNFFYILLYEFMIGLEITRLCLIFYVIFKDFNFSMKSSDLYKNTLISFAPYALVDVSFTYWRFFIFESARKTVSEGALISKIKGNPITFARNSIIEIFKDIFDTVILSWGVTFYKFITNVAYRDLFVALILGVISLALLWLGILILNKNQNEFSSKENTALLIIGAISLLSGLFTIVIPGRNVLLNHAYGRYSLHVTLGVAMFIVGFLNIIKGKTKVVIFSLLVFLAVNTQYLNNLYYMNDWQVVQNTWWQIYWRVPQFKPDTLILLNGTYEYTQDYEIWGPANILYYPDSVSPQIDAEVLYGGSVDAVLYNLKDSDILRDISLDKDFSNTILFNKGGQFSCVQAIDGDFPIISSGSNDRIKLLSGASSVNQIMIDNEYASILPSIFGEEPAHEWCYYYQKASLARQELNWDEVVRLGKEAQENGFTAYDASEWVIFVEANLIQGNRNQAKWMSSIIKSDKHLKLEICSMLDSSPPDLPNYPTDDMLDLICK